MGKPSIWELVGKPKVLVVEWARWEAERGKVLVVEYFGEFMTRYPRSRNVFDSGSGRCNWGYLWSWVW